VSRQQGGSTSKMNLSKTLFGRPPNPAVNAHRQWSKIKKQFSRLPQAIEEEVKAEIRRRYEISPKVSPEEGQNCEVQQTTQPATQPSIYYRKRCKSRRSQRRRWRERHQQALTWDIWHTERFIHRADQLVGNFGEVLQEQYGFLADPTLPLWQKVEIRIGEMDLSEFKARPTNMSCHNLLRYNVIPKGTTNLLGIGLNYCIMSPQTDQTTRSTVDRLCQDVQRKYAFSKNPPDNDRYILKLYIKSDCEFKSASKDIDKALRGFQTAVQSKQKQCIQRREPSRNLSVGKWNLI